MIGKLQEGCTVTSVAAKCTAVRELVVATRGRQLHWMTDISSCRRKEAASSQQAPLLSNSAQQRGDKCRGLL
ncbi:hypothetical protein TNCV_4070191 [Trichonephila clavipes]|nr:hypothetical protein TNCV_4070191 [Trichonephila clavipes]